MRRGTTRKAPPTQLQPLAATNPAAGIVRLRNRIGELERLDPTKPTDPAFEVLEDLIHSNIREIFGEGSHEDDAHWSDRIYDGPLLLGWSDEDDEYEGSYGHDRATARRVKGRSDGITRMKLILESLIKRLEERAADRAGTQAEGDGDMGSPLDNLAEDLISLVKPDGTVAASRVKAIVDPKRIMVSRPNFPVERGDTIVREMHAGLPPESYQVLDLVYIKAPGGMSHWEIGVRRAGSLPERSAPSPMTATHITNHNYNISGPTAAVGPGANANDNAIIQHNNQQTLTVDLDTDALADDLAAIKKLLLAQAADNDDDHEAAVEAAKVAKAQKAIKAGERSNIVSAVRTLGAKTWALGERLALAYVNFKLRDQLGLPPGDQ